MSGQRQGDEMNRASRQRYAERGKGSGSNDDAVGVRRHYVDPAEEAMSRNHNLSPPIHPKLEHAPPGPAS
jgi:hypothetical protein